MCIAALVPTGEDGFERNASAFVGQLHTAQKGLLVSRLHLRWTIPTLGTAGASRWRSIGSAVHGWTLAGIAGRRAAWTAEAARRWAKGRLGKGGVQAHRVTVPHVDRSVRNGRTRFRVAQLKGKAQGQARFVLADVCTDELVWIVERPHLKLGCERARFDLVRSPKGRTKGVRQCSRSNAG